MPDETLRLGQCCDRITVLFLDPVRATIGQSPL